MTVDPSSTAPVVASAPLKLPIAVRAALTMTQFSFSVPLIKLLPSEQGQSNNKMTPEKSRAVMQ